MYRMPDCGDRLSLECLTLKLGKQSAVVFILQIDNEYVFGKKRFAVVFILQIYNEYVLRNRSQ